MNENERSDFEVKHGRDGLSFENLTSPLISVLQFFWRARRSNRRYLIMSNRVSVAKLSAVH